MTVAIVLFILKILKWDIHIFFIYIPFIAFVFITANINKPAVEEKLEKAEKKYRTLVNEIPDIIYRINPRGIFTFLNKNIISIGWNPEELIGKHFSTILDPKSIEAVSRTFVLQKYEGRKTGEKGSPKLFDERRTGDRSTKNLEIKLITKERKEVKYGLLKTVIEPCKFSLVKANGLYVYEIMKREKQFIGTMGIIRDITERKIKEKYQATALRIKRRLLEG